MTLQRTCGWLATMVAAGAVWIGLSAPAQAIPVFARQTGHNCQACHISYPELTAYGREFKLNGYTFGEAQPVPLAFAMMAEADQVSDNTIHNTVMGADQGKNCTTCGHGQITQWSLFFGGRITENLGMFGQASSNQNVFQGGSFTPTADNTEFRYVHRIMGEGSLEPEAVIGFNINNNLTMQDVWNSAPAWRFPWYPYAGPGTIQQVATGPFMENAGLEGESGGQRQVGIGVYGWFHKTIYAELSLYRSPWGPFSWMVWGNQQGGNTPGAGDIPSDDMKGYNPYYRLAYSRDWDYSSFEVGIFGINAKTYNCSQAGDSVCSAFGLNNGETNSYHDIGLDMQYQFIKNDPWVFTASGSWIHSKDDLSAILNAYNVSGGAVGQNMTSATHTFNELNIRGTLYYQRKYGVTLGYTSLSGSSDPLLYAAGGGPNGEGGSATGSPNTSNLWLELNYLPMQDLRFSILYKAYTKLNGGSSNFDGFGNNASGQNQLTGAIWWVF